MMTGCGHGCGNTSVALNLAALLASRGYRTLLVETCCGYPLLPAYFELGAGGRGIREAVEAFQGGDAPGAVRPQGEPPLREMEEEDLFALLRPDPMEPEDAVFHPAREQAPTEEMEQVWSVLPESLAFLVTSREDVGSTLTGQPRPWDPGAFAAMLSRMLSRGDYEVILVDLQPEQRELRLALAELGSQLVTALLTLTQDPHALAVADFLLGDLGELWGSATCILNRCTGNSSPGPTEVGRRLELEGDRVLCLPEDVPGYRRALEEAMPPVLNPDRPFRDYEGIVARLWPGT